MSHLIKGATSFGEYLFTSEVTGRQFRVAVWHDRDDAGEFATFDIEAVDGQLVSFKESDAIKRDYWEAVEV